MDNTPEKRVRMAWAMSCYMKADKVAALLDEVEEESKGRPDFEYGLERKRVEGAIHALLWAYGSRCSDTAFGYAMSNLYACLGIDWPNSTIKWLPEDENPTPTGQELKS